MATVSDEAFAYLLVGNYWDYWSNLNLQDYKTDATYDKEFNKKIKWTATWGKYTKIAYRARRYGGWTTSGLLRFNELFHQVQADRLKNGEIVEEEYVQYCIMNNISPKKWQRQRIVMLLQFVKISQNTCKIIHIFNFYVTFINYLNIIKMFLILKIFIHTA